MSKQSNKEKQPAKERDHSHNEMNENKNQHVSNDRSFRHISEIDCREGEMEHGETGGFNLRPSSPDNDERA